MESNRAEERIHDLIEESRFNGMEKTDRIQRIMSEIEELANTSLEDAVPLMKALQPIADDLYMHDVYNSIELWIDHAAKSKCQNEK